MLPVIKMIEASPVPGTGVDSARTTVPMARNLREQPVGTETWPVPKPIPLDILSYDETDKSLELEAAQLGDEMYSEAFPGMRELSEFVSFMDESDWHCCRCVV